jgi:DNA modification methylase
MKSKTSRQHRAAAAASATPERDLAPGYAETNTNDVLRALVRRYQEHRRPISVNFRKLLPGIVSADRFTHLIHPYPAKLLVHIPFFFLANNLLSKQGDPILDPFCGSGTVMLEAQLSGRSAYGVDCNPLARLIANTKTEPLDPELLHRRLRELLERVPTEPSGKLPDVVNLRHWFYPGTIKQLRCLREAIARIRSHDLRRFFRVCFSVCVRKVSLADPRLSVPVRLRRGQYPEHHRFRKKYDAYLRRLRQANVREVFARVVRLNIARMERLHLRGELPPSTILCSDARHLHDEWSLNGSAGRALPENSIQLIITSPPYPGAQKYIRSCSLSLGWLQLCSTAELRRYKGKTIGREEFAKFECARPLLTGIGDADRVLARIRKRSPVRATIAAAYLNEMRSVIIEMNRVLKPGGHLVLVAANNCICGRDFRTVDYLRAIALENGFSLTACFIDAIRSRGLMTKRNTTASVITREWVLLLTKGGVPTWSR